MAMHTTSGRWQLGLGLSMLTALFWATLPISLKISLEVLDVWTITWIRFGTAAVVLFIVLAVRGKLTVFTQLSSRVWWLMALAALMLTGNFVGYLFGVQFTTPGNAQLLIQAAPLLMALGGIVFFGERFKKQQWLGLALVAIGLMSFVSDQRGQTASTASNYTLGAIWILAAGMVWAVYALLQKQLLNHLGSQQLLLFIYAAAALLLTPMASPTQLMQLDRVHGLALAYCCINTLGAYGAFAEALAHWEASRVGVVLALTPLMCVGVVALTRQFNPDLVAPEHIAFWGWLGAALVIAGSALVSLTRRAPAR